MFLLRRPGKRLVARAFHQGATAGFNYAAKRSTIEKPPSGFFRNDTSAMLGEGEECWMQAVEALRRWRATRLRWCEFLSLTGEPVRGDMVVARVKHLGFWSLQPSRIVDVYSEPRCYAFTIRTLPQHDEQGEERFEVEWLSSGQVRFRIRSYSRPAHLAGWLALSYVRYLQRRFARDAMHIMQSQI